MILTPHAERAIETLRIGEHVVTASGAPKTVRWLGRMHCVRPASGTWDWDTAPIRVARNALGDNVPARDLCVSNAHCFLIDGYLVKAVDLINGVTITKCIDYDASELTYYHIELDTHDVVLANGAPAESLRGDERRKHFDNYVEYERLYGPALPVHALCAPIVGYYGGRDALKSRLRSAIAVIYDFRRPLDVIRDDVEARAHRTIAA